MLFENIGKAKSCWHQRVAIYRDFGEFLMPDIPEEHIGTPPTSLALLTQLTKGVSADARKAHLDEIAGLSFADVKKYVAERTGKAVCDCTGKPVEKVILCCPDCGKRAKQETGEEIAR